MYVYLYFMLKILTDKFQTIIIIVILWQLSKWIWKSQIWKSHPGVGPPGGRRTLSIVPSVSLHAVKGSEWIVRMVLGNRSLTIIFLGMPWLVDWTTCSILDNNQALVGLSKGIRPNVSLPLNLHLEGKSDACRNMQTQTELDFIIHKENWFE